MTMDPTSREYFGWRVTRGAFVLAVFGLGMGFHGPGIYLHAVQAARGWPVETISAAVTAHFLVGAVVTANLPALHRRWGLAAVTKVGALALAMGVFGWSVAPAPWALFLAATASGAGWVTMGVAALNAFVAPWFERERPKALAIAYNGANVGGVIFTPLWAFSIGLIGFPAAAAVIGIAVVATVWRIADSTLSRSPPMLIEAPGGTERQAAAVAAAPHLWRNRQFLTLAAGMALGLFAQIGIAAHLYSCLVPAIGDRSAGVALAWASLMAVVGRTCVGWLLRPGRGRAIRHIAAASYGVQIVASIILWNAGDTKVAALLVGVTMYGLAFGNGTFLPPLIAQAEFPARDVGRVVALVVALAQAAYAFAPATFGLVRAATESGPASAPGTLFVAAAVVQALAASAFLAGRRRS